MRETKPMISSVGVEHKPELILSIVRNGMAEIVRMDLIQPLA